ncbi:nuclear transport factor 2 family protein [Actinoplanes solisilvae]|uniref:nuclear transport factor 2 family protein n=1 Tax=Actinoplanes solisilvae TaxID=2486853 RepID=UPI000FDB5135|nr:nuclear transport factor 2 family protein [Actinoplanes solisilvae]
MDNLSQAITDFFKAVNAQDTDQVVTMFTADAVVTDEGKTLRGHDEIRQWSDMDNVAVQVVLTPTGMTTDTNGTIVEVRAEGSFPGSPLPFVFRFRPSDADFTSISGLAITYAG